MRKHGFRIPVVPAGVRSTKQAKAYAELKSVRVIWKKCEARNPNTCCACESAKHEAGKSLCRVKKQKKYLEEVQNTDSEYLLCLR